MSGIEVAGIYDIAPLESCAYLFRNNPLFGPYKGKIETTQSKLVIDGQLIVFTHTPDISLLNLSGLDVVLERSGTATSADAARRGLAAGAKAVLISGLTNVAGQTFAQVANENPLGTVTIVSNASCTTNAIAPLLKVLDMGLGIERGHITTIHCYTGSQPTVDEHGPSFERS